jgi:hypothetical protein
MLTDFDGFRIWTSGIYLGMSDSEKCVLSLAIYTTVYPGVEKYLTEWYRSVCEQTDQDFQLWVGLDGLTIESVQQILGSNLKAKWVVAPHGSTPAQIRQLALSRIVQSHSGVVLVDSDDLLHPTRAAAAREALQRSELAGCALRLTDVNGEDLGLIFGLPSSLGPEDVFPRNNVFGFSNSTYRSELLSRCLPIPREARLVDWYLATKAWLLGAKFAFDCTPRMDYRQHAANMARVRPPFAPEQIVTDTQLVREHFQCVLADRRPDYVPERYATLVRVAEDVEGFHERIALKRPSLESYAAALNALKFEPLWWACVAHPELQYMWS